MTSARPPAAVWEEMRHGNERFVAGEPLHPRQDVERRHELAGGQAPRAVLFGCSDSRLAAEIIFDMGLGDLFVVRNAGQVPSRSVLGSLEYAVEVLGVPLLVVLRHDNCGAVQAAIDTATGVTTLPPHIRELVDPILAAVERARTEDGSIDPYEVGREHVHATVATLLRESEILSAAVAEGRLAIVGANYRLLEGRVESDLAIGID